MTEFLRSDVMIAFAVMTAVTVASRLGGYWLMGYVNVTPRVRRMLDALPGSIIVAAALPVAGQWRAGGGFRNSGCDGSDHHPPQRLHCRHHRHGGSRGRPGARFWRLDLPEKVESRYAQNTLSTSLN